jgi:L-ascorbate metabolism protein UlaG (beta-lactamase superfamily)
VLTTPQAAGKLEQWGFETRALRAWDRTVLSQGDALLSVVAVPGVHAYGAMGRLLPPVMGSVLTLQLPAQRRRRVYISGDTLTGPHVDQIARAFPDVDCAVVHLGGTRVLLHTVTMDDVQGVDLLTRLAPAHAVPVHHDDYPVFRSPLSSFLRRAQRSGLATVITAPARGETVELFPVQ